MNITLKNIKHNEALSEETHCFSATVYVDSKRAFGIKNAGHGGSNDVYSVDKKTHREVLNMVASIDNELGKEKCPPPYESLSNCLEIVVGVLVSQYLIDRDIKKDLRKLAYVKNGVVWIVKAKPTQPNIEKLKKQSWWKTDYVILNELPIEDIRQYYN